MKIEGGAGVYLVEVRVDDVGVGPASELFKVVKH